MTTPNTPPINDPDNFIYEILDSSDIAKLLLAILAGIALGFGVALAAGVYADWSDSKKVAE